MFHDVLDRFVDVEAIAFRLEELDQVLPDDFVRRVAHYPLESVVDVADVKLSVGDCHQLSGQIRDGHCSLGQSQALT